MGQLQLGWLYTIYIPLSCLLRIGLTFFSSENVRRYIERRPCRSVARSLVLYTPRKEKLGYNLRNTQPGKSFLVSFFILLFYVLLLFNRNILNQLKIAGRELKKRTLGKTLLRRRSSFHHAIFFSLGEIRIGSEMGGQRGKETIKFDWSTTSQLPLVLKWGTRIFYFIFSFNSAWAHSLSFLRALVLQSFLSFALLLCDCDCQQLPSSRVRIQLFRNRNLKIETGRQT